MKDLRWTNTAASLDPPSVTKGKKFFNIDIWQQGKLIKFTPPYMKAPWLERNLCRFRFVLASGRRLWDQTDVDGAEVLATHPKLELPEKFPF
jgi:hypothetical protein